MDWIATEIRIEAISGEIVNFDLLSLTGELTEPFQKWINENIDELCVWDIYQEFRLIPAKTPSTWNGVTRGKTMEIYFELAFGFKCSEDALKFKLAWC